MFMDKEEQEIQPLTSYGIFRESFKIIFSSKKLLSQITIATIFPLSLISLTYVQMFEFLFPNILHNEEGSLKKTPNLIWGPIWPERIAFLCSNFAYIISFLALSLISTSMVVHAVALIYTRKEIIYFDEVISDVPKVWKRLTITFAWSFTVVFVYNMVASSLLFPWSGPTSATGPFLVTYVMGFVCISIIWHVASVVSVLEEDCGVEAMIKSMALVKGKMVILVAVFLVLNFCFILTQVVFQRFVVLGGLFWSRIMCGVGCFLFLCGFTLLGNVVQTVVYFDLIINKSCGLESYSHDYAPIPNKDDQLDI